MYFKLLLMKALYGQPNTEIIPVFLSGFYVRGGWGGGGMKVCRTIGGGAWISARK